jgi:hypothetical protein
LEHIGTAAAGFCFVKNMAMCEVYPIFNCAHVARVYVCCGTHLMHDMKTACPAAATALVAFESSPWCVRHLCWWMISWGVALPFKNIGEYRNPQTGNPYSPKFQTKTYWSRLGCFCNYPMGRLKGNYEYQQNTTSPVVKMLIVLSLLHDWQWHQSMLVMLFYNILKHQLC